MARGPALKVTRTMNGELADHILSKSLAKRLAKMHLTPASDSRTSGNIEKKKKKASSANNRKISSKEDVDRFDNTCDSHGTSVQVNNTTRVITEGSPPAIPILLYRQVKEAAEIMNNPKWPNDINLEVDLEGAEYNIDLICRIFSLLDSVPTGWKYERKHASSLIAGYDEDKAFIEGGVKYII